MGILIQFIDYAEDKNLYGYSLLCTTIALLFLGLFLLWVKEWSIHSPTKLPIVGIESQGYFALLRARRKFVSDGFRIVRDAYYKYRGKSFVITTNSYYKVVLTHNQVKELSNAPDDTVSFVHASAETMMAEYTGLSQFSVDKYIPDVLRAKLTQNLGSMKEALLDETRFALSSEIPGSATDDEWVPVEIFTAVHRIIARINGRIFIGLPLCRNEDWLTMSITFTGVVFRAIEKLAGVPKLIRPLYSYTRNLVKDINWHKRKARSLLDPIIHKRLEEESLAEENGAVYRKHNDVLQWFTDHVMPEHRTVEALTEMQLHLSMASVHTTTLYFLNAILDLAEHQECIQPIREEMEAVISANGGALDRTALRKMRKTDSFFREAMRGKFALFTFNRKVMKNLTLSDGTYFPKGTLLAAPSAMLSTDPEFVEDPETFDGFRWYKRSLEVKDSGAEKNNWGTTASYDLTFGHGKHACPGRYYATEEMKLMLTFILLQYDIKYPEGQSRPVNFDRGEYSYPNRAQKLLFRKLPGKKKFPFL
ncbi:cytochrome P450 [Tuber magnatum]|uniref:Cytochrome P450 n=1 Tax=Tuber magnatum TaxID=42249 RepID=A0A317SUG3_9PEZI|nr:cytochrome P450 [Tuber magnatum]